MGQLCSKCIKGEEGQADDLPQQQQGNGGCTEAPLLAAAEPVATEAREAQLLSNDASSVKSPVAEAPEVTAPVAETPGSESLVAKSSLPQEDATVPDATKSPQQDERDRETCDTQQERVRDISTTQQEEKARNISSVQEEEKRRETSSRISPDSSTSTSPPVTTIPTTEPYLDYPILCDLKTTEYVRNSKVMVIMKGLPGSGKSFISDKLKQRYSDAVVCSADYYFMKDGKYQFNPEKLSLAHESCQENTRKAASDGVCLIIIDNTNLRVWNYTSYLALSKEYHYTPIIVEPKTPWAKDTAELARRTRHGVKKDILDQKLKTYQEAFPLYYWWFLNEADSAHIIAVAQDWLTKAFQVQNFLQDFSDFSRLSSIEEMLTYYKKNEGNSDYKVLHATVCVTKRGKGKNAKEYMAKKIVKDSLGKCFTLRLVGFVITPRTFGVRVRLGEDTLELWGMDDHEVEDPAAYKQPSKADNQGNKGDNKRVALDDTSVRKDSCQTTLRKGPSLLDENRFCPTSGKGSKAHLTLGCAPGIPAKITGFDLIKVVSREQETKTQNIKQSSETVQTFSIPGGELRTYGNSLWVIYPENEIIVSALFSGFY